MTMHIQVHRVLIADSGTLMICLVDTHGKLGQLRQQLHKAFPGCPTRQTTIAHVSVLRLFRSKQISTANRQQLQAVCDDYTQKLKGVKFIANELW